MRRLDGSVPAATVRRLFHSSCSCDLVVYQIGEGGHRPIGASYLAALRPHREWLRRKEVRSVAPPRPETKGDTDCGYWSTFLFQLWAWRYGTPRCFGNAIGPLKPRRCWRAAGLRQSVMADHPRRQASVASPERRHKPLSGLILIHS